MAHLDTNVGPIDRGLLVASLLHGSWRAVPGEASLSQKELELILPILIRSGNPALAWRRIRHTPLASTPPGERVHEARRIQAAEAAIRAGQIERILSQDGMREADPILVKGWANARFYPEDGLRRYTDIDLIVRPDRYEAAVRAAAGVVLTDPDRAIPVDIGRNLRDVPDRSWEQISARSRIVNFRTRQVTVLGDEDTLRLACLHLLHHFGFHPIWLCDVAVLVERVAADFDWDYCLSGQPRLTEWMLAVIRLANQLLGASLDRCPAGLVPRSVPRWMVRTILAQWGTEASFQHRWLPDTGASHWPDPLQAVGRLGWPINDLSGRMAQILYFAARPVYRIVRHRILRRKATFAEAPGPGAEDGFAVRAPHSDRTRSPLLPRRP